VRNARHGAARGEGGLPVFMYNFNMPWQIEFGPDANGHDDCSSTPASRT
jgi:hypothetical protein